MLKNNMRICVRVKSKYNNFSYPVIALFVRGALKNKMVSTVDLTLFTGLTVVDPQEPG